MLKTKTQQLTVIFILIAICVFLIRIYQTKTPPTSPSPLQSSVKTEPESSAFFEVNGIKYEGKIPGEISVYDFMEKLKKDKKINFEARNYAGMGEFIESINGIKNSDKSWIYYVNGKKAEIGVSNYKIKKGDIVSFRYEKYY